jgi:FG-GAP-like repeat
MATLAFSAASFCWLSFAEEKQAPKPAGKPKGPAGLKWRVQKLFLDNNEGCSVADFNRDGKPDISAGEFWYPGPDFTEQKPLRKLEPFGKDYLSTCGEQAYDVNGDGWPDVVSCAFMDTKIYWYENPGAEGLKTGALWKQHLLIDTGLVQNEWNDLRDLDGDGVPEFIVNSWNETNPMMAYKFAKNDAGEPILKPWIIHEGGKLTNGHGIGYGDINGDGKEDILFGNGWYERPKDGAADKPWVLHNDWTFPHASTPMIVTDLNGDGRNDIIWGHGHNYGLYWEERRDDNKDGSTNWRHHLIDDRFSQPHVLVYEDIDGDGQPELITGRRHKAHSGNDPGDSEPGCLYYYKLNKEAQKFQKFTIAEDGPGVGLQVRVVDLNGDGRKDIVVAGKSGTYVIWNQGK